VSIATAFDCHRHAILVAKGEIAHPVFAAGISASTCAASGLSAACSSQVSKTLSYTCSRAAYQLDAKEGIANLRQQAAWLKREHKDAAASLLEGLEESFTVNALGLPPVLMRPLASTNIVESPNRRVREVTAKVSRWRDADMVLRWSAAGFLEAEKSFRRIQGYRHLWILQTALRGAHAAAIRTAA